MINNKKAAMFGLDARIALAIFAALSVITGAVLYKAIENVKATAVLVEMQEVGKAVEQYYLDNGTMPVISNYEYCATSLIEDTGLPTWKGPYLEGFKPSAWCYILKDGKGVQTLALKRGVVFGGVMPAPADSWTVAACSAGKICDLWAVQNNNPNEKLAKIIDKKVDNGDGSRAGDFRWYYSTGADEYVKYRYILKVFPVRF